MSELKQVKRLNKVPKVQSSMKGSTPRQMKEIATASNHSTKHTSWVRNEGSTSVNSVTYRGSE